MNTQSPHLHAWLDAIQRGRSNEDARPQLLPDVPVPSADDQVALQALHRELTGEQLSAQWLGQVLQPMPAGTLAPITPSVPEEAVPEKGWKHWRGLWRRQRERPVHQFRTDREARQSFLRWRRATLSLYVPGWLLMGGGGWWALGHLAPKLMQLQAAVKAGVVAAGSEAAFQAQPLAHQLSAELIRQSHQLEACAYLIITGSVLLMVGNVLSVFQKNRKVAKVSVANQVAWLHSPRAQRYLQQRFPGQPFLVGDRIRLNLLSRSDQVDQQMVAAPLADREPPTV